MQGKAVKPPWSRVTAFAFWVAEEQLWQVWPGGAPRADPDGKHSRGPAASAVCLSRSSPSGNLAQNPVTSSASGRGDIGPWRL